MTDNLIAKLEAAEGPSQSLDLEIAKVLSWHSVPGGSQWTLYAPPGKNTPATIPAYTASLDAARSISSWVLITASDIAADGLSFVRLGDPGRSPPPEASGCHNHLAIAWCIAALHALNFERTLPND